MAKEYISPREYSQHLALSEMGIEGGAVIHCRRAATISERADAIYNEIVSSGEAPTKPVIIGWNRELYCSPDKRQDG